MRRTKRGKGLGKNPCLKSVPKHRQAINRSNSVQALAWCRFSETFGT
nr:MAG TPA: hypothetical protein [Caudoviricetes sp.]